MAISKWANVTLDPAAGLKNDRADHRNTGAPGAADGGNLTVAWDPAVITRMTLFDSAVATARNIAASQLPP